METELQSLLRAEIMLYLSQSGASQETVDDFAQRHLDYCIEFLSQDLYDLIMLRVCNLVSDILDSEQK
jgi:fibrillarin-like rRNA methylase